MSTTRLHRPWLYGLIQTLNNTFNAGFYADKVLEKHFQANKKMGARDRRFFAETFYSTVRWWRRLRYAAELPEEFTPGEVLQDDFKKVLTAWLLLKEYDLGPFIPEGWDGDQKRIKERWDSAPQGPCRESYPDWLWQKGEQELGEQWLSVAQASNFTAPIFLRANRLKTTPEQLQEALAEEEIITHLVDGFRDALKLEKRANVFITQAFKKGLFEVQDAGSQTIAPFLQVESGQRVVDACAGAGGKSLHLAALMKNKGKILAMDTIEWKLKELRRRSSRAGADTIEVRAITSSKVVKRLAGKMDRVLLDVPCSGAGVLRRNPDSKWKMSTAECQRLLTVQADILKTYSSMVKPQGKLVYATCSVFPSENSEQVAQFLEAVPGWKLEAEKVLLPTEGLNDGFYAARLLRVT